VNPVRSTFTYAPTCIRDREANDDVICYSAASSRQSNTAAGSSTTKSSPNRPSWRNSSATPSPHTCCRPATRASKRPCSARASTSSSTPGTPRSAATCSACSAPRATRRRRPRARSGWPPCRRRLSRCWRARDPSSAEART